MPTIGPIACTDDLEIYWNSGVWNLGNAYFGRYNSNYEPGCFEFVLPSAIPAGATINSAYFSLYDTDGSGADDHSCHAAWVGVTNNADATFPTTIGERPSYAGGSTTTYPNTDPNVTPTNWIAWDTSSWSGRVEHQITITALIQYLVNTYGGLASGATIVIWVEGDDAWDGLESSYISVETGGGEEAHLYVDYTAGAVTLDQEGFRFRNDDGDETSASWLASQDANVTAPLDTNTRIRFVIDGVGDPAATQFQLEAKLSTDSVWWKVA